MDNATSRPTNTLAIGLLVAIATLAGTPLALGMPRSSGRVSLMPSQDASTATKRQLAIWSIDAFVEQKRSGSPTAVLLASVHPMPIPSAASILADAENPRREIDRRVALLRLLTWVPREPGVREAVETLVGSSVAAERIYEELAAEEAGGGCAEIEEEERQLFINELVNVVVPRPYKGCADVPAMMASVQVKGETVIVASKVIAEGSLADAKAGLDPQRWATCSPLWKESYLTQADAAGTPIDNSHCTPNPGHVKCRPLVGAAEVPGSGYDTDSLRRPFFERFVCDENWCDVRVLLRIVTKPPPVSSHDYELKYDNPRRWKSFSFPPVDYGTVTVDAHDLPGGKVELTVKADKTFAFDDSDVTLASYYMLRSIEMGTYLADLVCCAP